MTDITYNRIINIAIETGKIMLTNGAETYRVEETVKRMIESHNIGEVNVFVIPTGIIVSTNYSDFPVTRLVRVSPSGIDLEGIDHANAFSRAFSTNTLTLDEAEDKIKSLNTLPKFSKTAYYLLGGMAGGFFVLLFGGTLLEFLMSYIASITSLYFLTILHQKKLNFFIRNILGSFLGSFVGMSMVLLINQVGYQASFDMVIIGPLMTMVPGVSLTNGIRDLISGELLAGSAKIMEALFIAIALAFGVGMVIQLVIYFT